LIDSAINDVNYVLKKTPGSKPIIAHIDKLRPYFGKVPTCWKTAMAKRAVEVEHKEPSEQSNDGDLDMAADSRNGSL